MLRKCLASWEDHLVYWVIIFRSSLDSIHKGFNDHKLYSIFFAGFMIQAHMMPTVFFFFSFPNGL